MSTPAPLASLDRIEAALDRIEAVSRSRAKLPARHRRLREEVERAIAGLDRLLDPPSDG